MRRAGAVSATLFLASGASGQTSSAGTWQRWEHVSTASGSYANPYRDHTLSVTYANASSGESYDARGYWSGNDTFTIRFMFPTPGIWTWETSFSDASDSGLHGQTGQVNVTQSTGSNPLYARGGLQVGPAGRRLVHADGTPFLMLGDQAWLAYTRATDQEWVDYLDDRLARGFNTIIISVGSTDQGSQNPEGNRPFPGGDASTWSNAFWENVDEMILAANERGIVIVACGLITSNKFESEEEGLAFARNFAARVAGSHVILSPRQDWGNTGLVDENLSAVAASASAPLQLITQHLDRRPMPEHGIDFHPESYLDFSSVQTNKGDPRDEAPTTLEEASRAQIEWVDALYRESPAKPVVVLEGIHENEVDQTLLRREIVRRQAYLSFVGGAYGFVASAFGVWTWGQGAGFRPEWGDQSLAGALELPYNDYIGILDGFLDEVDVASLEPYAERLVLNQSADYEHLMLMAKRADDSLAVAYLPDNAEIELDLSSFPDEAQGRWFRPETGTWVTLPAPVPNTASQTLVKPSGWNDAVLVLEVLPEPALGLSLACGGTLLARLARRRRASLDLA